MTLLTRTCIFYFWDNLERAKVLIRTLRFRINWLDFKLSSFIRVVFGSCTPPCRHKADAHTCFYLKVLIFILLEAKINPKFI